MPLPSGTRLGPYEVLGTLGAGGMGEVYRARDTALSREVALKVLPDAFAKDAERLARFTREAQTLAALNHPNIAHIHGLEQSSDVRALVMELVDGEDLSAIVARGPMLLGDAMPIARQIADALEAAHSQGIVHRDLKPANIKIRPDGAVKVLDFGLAKALETTSGVGSPSSVSMSPTLTNATAIGVILGTAAYMAPEQARGKAVDKRADIWAFGCVLYEMLSGRRAFGGDEISDTLAFVITKDVEWSALPADTPSTIRRLLRRCIEKDPKKRLHDIADARIELDEPAQSEPAAVVTAQGTSSRRPLAMTLGAVVVASLLTAIATWAVTRPEPRPRLVTSRLTLTVPQSTQYSEIGGDLAISPDGTRLVYAVVEDGKRVLYLRALDQLESRRIPGSEDAANPFFSPDGEWIAFGTAAGTGQGRLKKVAVRGGPALTVAETSVPTGTWLDDNTLVFTRSTAGSTGGLWELLRVPASGGPAERISTPKPDASETRHAWPERLPGGQAILMSVAKRAISFEDAHIAVLSLATGEYHTVVEQGYHARYVASESTASENGHIVYVLGGNLMAVPFNVSRLQTTGPPAALVEGIRGRVTVGEASFAVSAAGHLIYAPGLVAAGAQRTLSWVDRSGKAVPIAAPPRAYVYPRLSPDGQRAAIEIRDQENDIWVWEFARQSLTRLTFDPQADGSQVWSPDGRRLFFASGRSGAVPSLYQQNADGSGQAERLIDHPTPMTVFDVTGNGAQLIVGEAAANLGISLLTIADRRVSPLIHGPFLERSPSLSPDGRWIAYESNESGVLQIYVRPFPAVNSGRWQVSTNGGTRPVWARSGRELFYVITDPFRMMAVPILPGATFAAGIPQQLFEGRYLPTSGSFSGRTYDVTPDGQRFLVINDDRLRDETQTGPTFVVVSNWLDELRRIAPPSR